MKSSVSKFKLLLGLLLLATLCWSCRLPWLPKSATENPNLQLGNPSPVLMQRSSQFTFIDRVQYALLYDRVKNTAAWASWQLNRDWLGQLERPTFMLDPLLAESGSAIGPGLYTGSGFDRGHLVPAADRNRTPEDSAAVFYMSNIVPQSPDNNRGPWEGLESYCRRLVLSGQELFIIAGPVGVGGVGSKGSAVSIGQGKIMVPSSLWKIVVVNDRPGLGLTGITASTRVIAVMIPNEQGIKEKSWRSFRTTVRAIEAQTGYGFLSSVPQSVQDVIEARIDQN